MTVASLWKALDRAGCGRAVGQAELQDHRQLLTRKATPWNINEKKQTRQANCPTLAVDLSIWICESLTSAAISNHHADPTLQLVYARTLRLLKLGIKLVVVTEGKRRTKGVHGELFTCKKRRSGTRFWAACQRCEGLLRLLGVPVVRAKAEGEALCALLNQRGIVDGVISNDGDCLLFGAKVLYTKFSLENLDNRRVLRYDADQIRACVDDDDDDELERSLRERARQENTDTVHLSRNDLIAFAILTGSDLAGNGISQVGCRKAIRFVKKCQIDNPLKRESAAIDELRSWAKAASAGDNGCLELPNARTETRRLCSCCGHPGNKRDHLKHGCQTCGTNAGEPCFRVSPGGKFRKSLRAKALLMLPKFDPEAIIEIYRNPNDDQIPNSFLGKTARSVTMEAPQVQELLDSSFIVRGHYLGESRMHLKQSLGGLLVQSELSSNACKNGEAADVEMAQRNRKRPIPNTITKSLIRSGTAYFEIQWLVRGSTTDSDGNSIDEFEFSTVAEQSVIRKCYPALVLLYEKEEQERRKQGNTEQERRKAFLDSMCPAQLPPDDSKPESGVRSRTTRRRSRRGFFGNNRGTSALGNVLLGRKSSKRNVMNELSGGDGSVNPKKSALRHDNTQHDRACVQIEDPRQPLSGIPIETEKREESKIDAMSCANHSIRVAHLCSELCQNKGVDGIQDEYDYSTIASSSAASCMSPTVDQNISEPLVSRPMTPGHIHFLQQVPGNSDIARNPAAFNVKEAMPPNQISLEKSMSAPNEERLNFERCQVINSAPGRFCAHTGGVQQYFDNSCRMRLNSRCSNPERKRRRRSLDLSDVAPRRYSIPRIQPFEYQYDALVGRPIAERHTRKDAVLNIERETSRLLNIDSFCAGRTLGDLGGEEKFEVLESTGEPDASDSAELHFRAQRQIASGREASFVDFSHNGSPSLGERQMGERNSWDIELGSSRELDSHSVSINHSQACRNFDWARRANEENYASFESSGQLHEYNHAELQLPAVQRLASADELAFAQVNHRALQSVGLLPGRRFSPPSHASESVMESHWVTTDGYQRPNNLDLAWQTDEETKAPLELFAVQNCYSRTEPHLLAPRRSAIDHRPRVSSVKDTETCFWDEEVTTSMPDAEQLRIFPSLSANQPFPEHTALNVLHRVSCGFAGTGNWSNWRQGGRNESDCFRSEIPKRRMPAVSSEKTLVEAVESKLATKQQQVQLDLHCSKLLKNGLRSPQDCWPSPDLLFA